MKKLTATGASTGIAAGPVFVVNTTEPVVPEFAEPGRAYTAAANVVVDDLNALRLAAEQSGRTEAAEILGAQALMAEDPMLAGAVTDALAGGASLGAAIDEAATALSDVLAGMADEYLAARSADVLEIAQRIRHKLAGTEDPGLSDITSQVVVVAETLTAADTAQLDPALVLGFVTEQGGPTSHVAVIARALGIPAVVGAGGATDSAEDASTLVLDGDSGEVVFDPTDDVAADYEARARRAAAKAEIAARYRGKQVEFGGRTVRVAANVGSSDDISRGVEVGADGIGLFRTEFLFLGRDKPPSEDEQYEAYVEAVAAFADPVVIRTLDIGGDKPAPYLDTPEEENPFLGERGVRIYSQFPDLFMSQAKALLRAATSGDLWVMLPMVATVADLLAAKSMINTARDELVAAGVEMRMPKVGVMIEVPSAAVGARGVARHADFFSIGTNDLTQYTLAADRTNGRLSAYADAANPAVLGLCRLAAQGAAEAGISISVCGEAAADPVTAAMFVAMGVDKLSVSPPSVNRVKALLDDLNEVATGRALEDALGTDSADEVRSVVGELLGESLL